MRRLVLLAPLVLAPLSCAARPRPWVHLWSSTAPQVCAADPRQHSEHPVLHAHIRAFADPRPAAAVQPGDLLRITVGDPSAGGASRTFHAGGIVSVDFPGSLGTHLIAADWLDASGTVKHRSETVISVWRCVE